MLVCIDYRICRTKASGPVLITKLKSIYYNYRNNKIKIFIMHISCIIFQIKIECNK